jgi:OmpA-OmpF porin, OOP family
MNRLLCLVLVVAFAQATAAQEVEEDRGPYLGLSLGAFDYEQENGELGMSVDDTTPAYRIIGGYRFNEHFALEGSWGKSGDLGESTVFGNVGADIEGEYEVRTIRAIGILPLGEKVSLYGALGYYDAKLDATVTTTSFLGSFDVEDTSDGPTLAVGVLFDLERVDVRAEIERFIDAGSDALEFKVGVFFRF